MNTVSPEEGPKFSEKLALGNPSNVFLLSSTLKAAWLKAKTTSILSRQHVIQLLFLVKLGDHLGFCLFSSLSGLNKPLILAMLLSK